MGPVSRAEARPGTQERVGVIRKFIADRIAVGGVGDGPIADGAQKRRQTFGGDFW